MIPDRLQQEAASLRAETVSVEIIEADDWIYVVFPAYPVVPGYSQAITRLLLKVPVAYPNAGPDMFWTDDALVLAGGPIPKSAEAVETILGKNWRRFSWHPQNWNPGSCSLRTYLAFVDCRLSKGV